MTIPYKEGEPAPIGTVLSKDKDTGELAWADPEDVISRWKNDKPSPLSPELRERVAVMRKKLGDADIMSLEEWLKGFAMDRNPEKEIATWEKVAISFEREVARREVTRGQKVNIITVLVMTSMGMTPREIISSNPALKKLDVQAIANAFFDQWPS